MENTTESAKSFLTKYRDERTHPVSVDYFAEMMVDYASACSAPSSIGEDEKNRIVQEVMEMHPYKVPGKPHTYSYYNQGWEDACDILDQHLTKWAISRLSERKIVLPSEDDLQKYYEGIKEDDTSLTIYDAMNIKIHWNAAIECIKRLNGIKSQP